MRRPLVLFLTLLLLWAGTAQINGALAPEHITLFVGGLFVVYAALALPLADGLVASLLAGGVCDANTPPVAFGTHGLLFGAHLLLFATVHVLIFAFRERLPHDHTAGRIGIALAANLTIFLALSFLRAHGAPARAGLWSRLVVDLAGSEIFVALIAPWFFSLQEKALALLPPDPERMF